MRCFAPRHSLFARFRGGRVVAAALLTGGLLFVPMRATAGDHVPYPARARVEIANVAAQAWAGDASLVYIENDEMLDASGSAVRWGYLFYSPALKTSRAYSVRDDKILVAENLEVKFEAPPLGSPWIDSGAALAAAEAHGGEAFRRDHQGSLKTMLLMRGVFDDKQPDATTWTLIYSAPGTASLFIVVDAADGKVRRTWRG